ncbi:phosphate ABC transporter permease subunit PstC [Caproiciproducens sp. NJN-50]|uniref:phosphate ABC transporter permease subunit PstC n=1 Tax=Acutalibacteraceae TaxID=3082771 RepID=UPI000FFE1924|nr:MULTISPECIES: phosphate ABC transporter permease subunit PstC [Acutalibacteraceae]QAT51090.1 phosphate ABC transporter permease subunit PstC [Caproiciproducens sp. NJN-50]
MKKKETAWRAVVTGCGLFLILLTLSIGAFLCYRGIGTFTVYGHSVWEFLFSSNWNPADDFKGGGQVGAAIFIVGSLAICFLALLIATPFSLAAAIFMAVISPRLSEKLLQPAVEIFVGIPSVVYGWVGLTVLVPFIQNLFRLPYGYSVLAGGIVLAVMIFPTITSVSADSIRNVPQQYREAAYGLGSTRWQVIRRVLLPAARPGVLTGVILGLSRAFGEALAVAMVIGKRLAFPDGVLSPTNNLTAAIASDMGGAAEGGEYNTALWTMALLLLLISFVFILIVRRISSREAREQ